MNIYKFKVLVIDAGKYSMCPTTIDNNTSLGFKFAKLAKPDFVIWAHLFKLNIKLFQAS